MQPVGYVRISNLAQLEEDKNLQNVRPELCRAIQIIHLCLMGNKRGENVVEHSKQRLRDFGQVVACRSRTVQC